MRDLARTLLAAAALLALSAAHARPTDIATDPLARAQSAGIRPNLMLIVDDSGSMGWRHMPDYVNDSGVDKPRCNDSTCSTLTTHGIEGNPPWYAAQFNRLYYDPQITYRPAVDEAGVPMTSFGASWWTRVPVNAFDPAADTIDLVNRYPELVYCDSDTGGACRRNGIDTANPFLYNTAARANGFPDATGSGGFRFPRVRHGSPFYYDIIAVEHCSDERLTTCTLSTSASTAFPFPAPVRFCRSSADANSASAVSGSTGSPSSPRCQAKYAGSHTWARYGRFRRVDITPAVATYGDRPNRSDCAARPTCTYAEEMTNFANWVAYYSTRLQTMKTSVGRAFRTIDGRYRVGAVTINPGTPVSGANYVPIDTFEGVHRQNWYRTFYGMTPSGWTPLREALSRVGRHFAGIRTGINEGMNQDPVQFSCQANIALLTTDGYWNRNPGQRLDGSAIGDVDNLDSGFSTRAVGAFDGNIGARDSLADVAMYYYQTDLRPPGSRGALGTDVSTDNVPTTARNTNPAQHMITFTVGLGVDGLMRYRPDYETATVGDFHNIRTGNNTCPWASGICNWPLPAEGTPSTIDDLWHAAVNGRGRYVNAQDAQTLNDGLASALAQIKAVTGAAAASATSSPNVSATDSAIFSSTYRTVAWDGDLVRQSIDIVTGQVRPQIEWSAAAQLNAAVAAASDSRTIFVGVGGALRPFRYAELDATARTFFDNQCPRLSHCSSLSAADAAVANSGTSLVNYLRGQRGDEGRAFRQREFVLGDLVGSRPAYVADPRRNYGDGVTPSYFEFKSANRTRRPVVYVGGNGGMLHAFDAATGAELWAFVPRTVLPRLHRLADQAYGNAHQFFADGSPAVADAFVGGAWRTVLVAGLNAGGRGYYALDITNPTSPALLWEICADPALCSRAEVNLGLSFGNPVITKRASDGRWVVLLTSGYNNLLPGDGQGWLFVVDLATGAVLDRVATGAGSTGAPSGLARISAWATDPDADNTSSFVYGGDLEGNLWRFDLSQSPPAVLRLATLRDAAGRPQPVTTRPELGRIDGHRVVFVGTGRYLGVTDLADPASLVPPGGWSNLSAFYALKDSGTSLGDPRANGALTAQTISTLNATQRTVTSHPVDWRTRSGWVADFPTSGERVNLDPQLVLGTLVVTTNIPDTDACTAGGTSWIYQFDWRTGSRVSTAGQVLGQLRSATLTVGNTAIRLPDGSLKLISTGASGQKDTYALTVRSGSAAARRISWRELAR